MVMYRYLKPAALSLMIFLGACNGSGDGAGGPGGASTNPADSGAPAPAAQGSSEKPAAPRAYRTAGLIFAGDGASELDAQSLAAILESRGLTYRLVNSAELNAMSVDEIAEFGMIVVPGGYGGQMTRSLDPEARERVRLAVVERGVNYIGFCAGAFVAVGPTPAAGGTPEYGFSIVQAPQLLDYFYPYKDGNDDTAAAVPISFADGTQRSLFFWGGPALPEVPGGVVARYADGTPAIVQVRSGNAFITITGPHPEGPEPWKRQGGVTDPDGDDFDIAGDLIESTLKQAPVRSF